jgi:uncharacterized RDD family membrane protein YckC
MNDSFSKPWAAQAEHASLLKRLVAFWIDCFILLIPIFIINALFGVYSTEPTYPADATVETEMNITFLIVLDMMIYVVYSVLFECSPIQATLGKQLMHIEVCDLHNNRISYEQALIRNTLKYVSIAFLGLGFLILPFSTRKQALHDMISGCLVVKS